RWPGRGGGGLVAGAAGRARPVRRGGDSGDRAARRGRAGDRRGRGERAPRGGGAEGAEAGDVGSGGPAAAQAERGVRGGGETIPRRNRREGVWACAGRERRRRYRPSRFTASISSPMMRSTVHAVNLGMVSSSGAILCASGRARACSPGRSDGPRLVRRSL